MTHLGKQLQRILEEWKTKTAKENMQIDSGTIKSVDQNRAATSTTESLPTSF